MKQMVMKYGENFNASESSLLFIDKLSAAMCYMCYGEFTPSLELKYQSQ